MTMLLFRIFEISLSLSPLILAMMLFSKFADKKYQPKWKSWVWLTLSVYLIFPVRLFSEQAPIHIAMPNALFSQLPRPGTPFGVNNESTVLQGGEPLLNGLEAEVPATTGLSLYHILTFLWVIGIVVVSLYHFFHYVVYKRTLIRWGSPNRQIQSKVDVLKAKCEINRKIPALICKNAKCPLVIGFIKQYIILPYADYTDKEIEFILSHELTHIKKGHIWHKLMVLAATAIHWFNPFVWLMKRQSNKDLEICCDSEVAIKCDDEQLIEYGNTILHCIYRGRIELPSLSTYFAGSQKMIKERIANLGSFKMRKRGTYLVSICLATVLCMSSLVGCTIGQTQLPSPAETGASSNIQNQENQSKPSGINAHNTAQDGEYITALAKQQENFAEYAQKSGVFAGYHVANVVINTQNQPEGLDPHGFLVSANLGFSELLVQRDLWLNKGIEDGWIVSDKEYEENILSSPLTLVYADESITGPYITRITPTGNPMFENTMFSDGNYAAFEFETGNNEMEMMWFYNFDKNKITMASTWLKPVDTIIDIDYDIEGSQLDEFAHLADLLLENQSGVIFTNALEQLNDVNCEHLMAFTQSRKIENTENHIMSFYVVDTRDYSTVFNGAVAVTASGDMISWSDLCYEYIDTTEELTLLAKSFIDMFLTAASLL